MTSSSRQMIVLKTSDGKVFEVNETAAMGSQTIKNMIEDNCADSEIPVPNVTGEILAKVIKYLEYRVKVNPKPSEEDFKTFDSNYVRVDRGTLFELILAANYLDIKNLLDLTCQTAAEMIKGKTPEQIRRMFNIKNDFTPEEEEEVRKENAWAFE